MKLRYIFLQLPLWLLVFISFCGGIYAAATKLQGISWQTPIIILVIMLLYLAGRILDSRSKKEVDE